MEACWKPQRSPALTRTSESRDSHRDLTLDIVSRSLLVNRGSAVRVRSPALQERLQTDALWLLYRLRRAATAALNSPSPAHSPP
jgi:hypothetical protein